MSEGSRWSCASSLGGTCSISYDLGAVRDLSELRLGKGATLLPLNEAMVVPDIATYHAALGFSRSSSHPSP